MNIKETKKRIIQAGHKAVEELIKVGEEAIVTDSEDDLTADKLKNAAASKKLAILQLVGLTKVRSGNTVTIKNTIL